MNFMSIMHGDNIKVDIFQEENKYILICNIGYHKIQCFNYAVTASLEVLPAYDGFELYISLIKTDTESGESRDIHNFEGIIDEIGENNCDIYTQIAQLLSIELLTISKPPEIYLYAGATEKALRFEQQLAYAIADAGYDFRPVDRFADMQMWIGVRKTPE